jgi:ADP-heptose:LPS heptosyltransferase
MQIKKVLIIRFSSFGDVTQALSIPAVIRSNWPESEVHWVIREDLSHLLQNHPAIAKVHSLRRDTGLSGLLRLALALRNENFTHIYDAHNNTRSFLISTLLRFFRTPKYILKSQFRLKRFLLFNFRINTYEMPFSGQRDLLKPLAKWNLMTDLPPAPQLFLNKSDFLKTESLSFGSKSYIAIAPSAAFELKRWPVDHWKSMIQNMPNEHFVILGGPEDNFTEEILRIAPDRVTNLAGKLSLRESAGVVAKAKLLISNDTGLLHVAEQLGKRVIALMGPAPFGYPSRSTTTKLELNLSCKPCSKHGQGPCVNSNFHQCLKGISPATVKEVAEIILQENL